MLDNAFYCTFGDGASTGYYGVAVWSNHTAVAGEIIRQATTPTVGSERCFVCIIGGATGSVEPTWGNPSRGQKFVSSAATYQEATGLTGLNGDATNTPSWTDVHASSTAGSLGQHCKDAGGTHIFIISTAGTLGGSEPSWNTAAVGNTTTDNGATWTYIGLAANFTKWGAPFARISASVGAGWLGAGNKLFVGDNHAETIASPATVVFPGTNAAPNQVLCVNHLGNVPPLSADLTTGASWSLTAGGFLFSGAFLMRGLTIQTPTGATASNIAFCNSASTQKLKNCAVNSRGTTGGVIFPANGAGGYCEFTNTTISFNSSASTLTFNGDGFFKWRNTPSAISGTFASPLVTSSNTIRWLSVWDGVDISSVSGTLFSGTSTSQTSAILKDCKLNAGVTLLGATSSPAHSVDAIRCANGANNYRTYRAVYEGTQDTETTIVRSGGATDGTQAQSWKIVTSANCSPVVPFEAQPIRIWNDVVGSSRTVTLYGIWGGGAVPNNTDIWFDLEYYSSGVDPDSTLATCGLADELSTPSGQSSDASTWGGSTTAFKMSVTFTPQQKGYIYLTPKAGKASSTFYVDPAPVFS